MKRTIKAPKGFIPATSENFYELASKERQSLMRRAVKEGRGNLCRALNIYRAMEDFYDTRIKKGIAVDAATGETIASYFAGRLELVPIKPTAIRAPADIVVSTKTMIENGEARERLAATDQHRFVIDWLHEIAARDFDAIVELGSGYGRNLFGLYCRGGPAGIPYFAAEFTKAGREMTAILGRVDRKAPIKPVFFDHRAPDLLFIKKARRVLLFSCHSIEQVKNLPENYFTMLARAAPEIIGVHFEPFGFQLGERNAIVDRHRGFIHDQGFNENLVACLKAAEASGDIAIRRMAANVIAPQFQNPTSIAVWDNRFDGTG